MRAETFDSTLITFLEKTPFRPFTVALVNGDRVEVDHRNSLAVKDGLAVYIAPGNIPVIFDHEGVSQIVGDLMGKADEE